MLTNTTNFFSDRINLFGQKSDQILHVLVVGSFWLVLELLLILGMLELLLVLDLAKILNLSETDLALGALGDASAVEDVSALSSKQESSVPIGWALTLSGAWPSLPDLQRPPAIATGGLL